MSKFLAELHNLPLEQYKTAGLAPVLVFDSGVGGLSIVQALQARLPSLPLVYACDNAAFPYGQKDADWLQARVVKVIAGLIEQLQPSLIVIACNTASTLALAALRQNFNLPFVGVVPAIKPAALITRSGTLGLLATQGTVSRPYTQSLIQQFAPDCKVVLVGTNHLVELAEDFMAGKPPTDAELEAILQPLIQEERLDTVILGCTHFPLLQSRLEQVALQATTRTWHWVDSGAAIARRVAQLLQNSALTQQAIRPPASCWLTAQLPSSSRLPVALQSFGFQQINYLPLS